MEWLILVLVVLISAGNLADFVVGKKGNREIRNRLTDFYVLIGDGDWSGAFVFSGRLMSQFIDHILSPKVISFRYLLRLALVSASFSAMVIVGSILANKPRSLPWSEYPGLLGIYGYEVWGFVILANLLADFASWTGAKFLFESLGRHGKSRWMMLFVTSVALAYFSVALAVSLSRASYSVAASFADPSVTNHFGRGIDYVRLIRWRFFTPWNPGAVMIVNVRMFSISVLLPQILFVLSIAMSLIMFHGKSLLKSGLMAFLERIAESEKGVFTISATVLSAIVGILGALTRAIG
jgi:hypothetical protein